MGKSEATPTATKGEGEKVMVLTTLEVDPATEDPDLLDAIRKKNSAALTSILDPRDELSAKDSSNAAAAVWYFVMNGHHITGNLNLLTDLTPVCDRWVRSLIGTGLPMQVCARGSVNCNGIKLDDVWYVPGVTVNMVAGAQFSNQEISLTLDLTPVCDRWVRSHWDRAAHASLRTGICELQRDQAR
ncbi:hypothetical protein VPH35_096313 [Triticum aestivum]|nr:uncharacterized protein LOC109778963 isoform X1 [Aegilops tauschii subsp. strangulata]